MRHQQRHSRAERQQAVGKHHEKSGFWWCFSFAEKEIFFSFYLTKAEITGLQWEDIDLDNGMIEVNHTLVYYNHAENGCHFSIHTPKTNAGRRVIPMLEDVRKAFLEEKQYQEFNGLKCNAAVDGYTDFIFINRFGNLQHQGTLNKALRRIIRDCNDMQLSKKENKNSSLKNNECVCPDTL